MVRRAEYALGKAVRKGQADGTIRSHRQNETHGSTTRSAVDPASPYEFASHSDLYGDGKEGGNGAYAMADNATDEQFEEALTEARTEGNLSRGRLQNCGSGPTGRCQKPDT